MPFVKQENIPVGCQPPACQPLGGGGMQGWGTGLWPLHSEVQVEQVQTCLVRGRVALYGEVQSIMGNGHMRPPYVNRQNDVHTMENITFPQLRW